MPDAGSLAHMQSSQCHCELRRGHKRPSTSTVIEYFYCSHFVTTFTQFLRVCALFPSPEAAAVSIAEFLSKNPAQFIHSGLDLSYLYLVSRSAEERKALISPFLASTRLHGSDCLHFAFSCTHKAFSRSSKLSSLIIFPIEYNRMTK